MSVTSFLWHSSHPQSSARVMPANLYPILKLPSHVAHTIVVSATVAEAPGESRTTVSASGSHSILPSEMLSSIGRGQITSTTRRRSPRDCALLQSSLNKLTSPFVERHLSVAG
jgi:hypothetical protein